MISRLAPFTALAFLATGCATMTTDDDPVSDGALEVERSGTAMTGTYARAGSLVEFTATTAGGTTSVHLDVNGLAFDVTLDEATQVLRHDGHDGATFLEDREALVAMSEALRDELTMTAGMPMHEQILVRAVAYLAEAPPGYTLAPRELAAPTTEVVLDHGNKVARPGTPIMEEQDGVEVFVGVADGEGGVITDPAEIEALEADHACYQSGEDGILYLTSETLVPKTTTWTRLQEHDCASHCYYGSGVTCGPGSYKCKGECGPGCWGSGVYSYDCLDHDQCCREGYSCTSSSDPSCGDEWKEADDDFWRGRILWLY